jgi:signal transduction histidine kinase/CheY-like chemotaxis protein
MFLLHSIDLLGLLGLLVQTAVAWMFVSVLVSLRRRDTTGACGQFAHAFAALAIGLSALSVRFFQAHDVANETAATWREGQTLPTLCYVVYQVAKVRFATLLVAGSHTLAGLAAPRILTILAWPFAVLLGASTILLPSMDAALYQQSMLMIVAALWSLSALGPQPQPGTGIRLVRLALIAMAGAWLLHGVTNLTADISVLSRILLGFNSFIDMGVQIVLGTGLIIGVLQDSHRRVLVAELERKSLERVVQRDERLRALGTLVSGVAHELNNPLTVILGYADMMAKSGDAKARIIVEQAERCRGIVRGLSALATHSARKREDCALDELVARVVRGLDAPSALPHAAIRSSVTAGLRIAVDRVGLEQVLTNLLVNAVHASPPGGVVTLEVGPSAGGVAFVVRDEGPGIPSELRSRLFEPFFTTKAPGQGTGLGLAIAHAIVRAHGGSITVDDGPNGVGASFCVVLPNGEATPQSALAPPRQSRAPREGGRLLLIDDDGAVRVTIRDAAQLRGWTVEAVPTAEAALERGFADFDVVLCDLRMRGMGGIALHDRLAAEGDPVLDRFAFITGDLASPAAAAFSARCRLPLIAKPFDTDEFFAVLDQCAAARPQPS